jgi:hypothetical protein
MCGESDVKSKRRVMMRLKGKWLFEGKGRDEEDW